MATRPFAHVGDVNAVLKIIAVDADDNVRDVSTATTLEILVEDPDGNTATYTAALSGDGTDGEFQYQTASSAILDEAGEWRIQGHVVLSSGADFHTKKSIFDVFPVLS